MRKIEEKREERVEKALELLNQNLSLQDIAYELGVGEQTIRVYRRELIAQGRYEENYPRRSSQTPKFNIEKIPASFRNMSDINARRELVEIRNAVAKVNGGIDDYLRNINRDKNYVR